MDKEATRLFQIVSGVVMLSGFLSYPFWKGPWTKYAGLHAASWTLLWICAVNVVVLWTKSTKQPLFTLFLAVFTGAAGLIGLIMNYRR
ncbi:MAG: hypothetical protein KKC76_13035 [Proteobacteria bacterium]|nr:hypothetical protein [Pseudomonadota bacterium]MBU4294961.1 hypothetical protein [Pseudomonadota bacterium]MCG2746687.1 hypothetical protein [Desulfobulbaceae bacterium]